MIGWNFTRNEPLFRNPRFWLVENFKILDPFGIFSKNIFDRQNSKKKENLNSSIGPLQYVGGKLYGSLVGKISWFWVKFARFWLDEGIYSGQFRQNITFSEFLTGLDINYFIKMGIRLFFLLGLIRSSHGQRCWTDDGGLKSCNGGCYSALNYKQQVKKGCRSDIGKVRNGHTYGP